MKWPKLLWPVFWRQAVLFLCQPSSLYQNNSCSCCRWSLKDDVIEPFRKFVCGRWEIGEKMTRPPPLSPHTYTFISTPYRKSVERRKVFLHFLRGHSNISVSWPKNPIVASHKQAGQALAHTFLFRRMHTHAAQVCIMKGGSWTAASPFWTGKVPFTICSPHTQNKTLQEISHTQFGLEVYGKWHIFFVTLPLYNNTMDLKFRSQGVIKV